MRATAAEASAAASTNLDRSQQSRTFSSELSKMVGLMNYPSASKAQVLGDEFTYLGHASRRSPSTAAEVSAESQRGCSEEKKGEQGDVAQLCDAVSQLNLITRPSMEAVFQEIRNPRTPYATILYRKENLGWSSIS